MTRVEGIGEDAADRSAEPRARVERVLAWLGRSLDDDMWQRLERLAVWLGEEAVTAGGLGPNEADRIWDRHIADALVFGVALQAPQEIVLDVGTGVGLPALPLAITHPEHGFLALDRSGKRIDLVARASRILEIENVETRYGDVADAAGPYPAITARAVAPPSQMATWMGGLLAPGGMGVVGGRRSFVGGRVPEDPRLDIRELVVPARLLDSEVTLLTMVRRVDP